MRIRHSIWAASALLLSASVCVFQVDKRQAQAQAEDEHMQPDPDALKLYNALPQAEKDARKQKGVAFRAAIAEEEKNNFKPKFNNGLQRAGLTLDQLPNDLQKEAGALADEYTKGVYPILKRYAATHEGALASAWGEAPALRPHVLDRGYKGTGSYIWGRDSWVIEHGLRLDGSVICRELPPVAASASPSETLHDVWAGDYKFMDVPQLGRGFLIHGWDDGKVTFDPVETVFRAVVKTAMGERSVIAPPGQSGIPPEIKTHIVAPEIYAAKPKAKTDAAPDKAKPEAPAPTDKTK